MWGPAYIIIMDEVWSSDEEYSEYYYFLGRQVTLYGLNVIKKKMKILLQFMRNYLTRKHYKKELDETMYFPIVLNKLIADYVC